MKQEVLDKTVKEFPVKMKEDNKAVASLVKGINGVAKNS